MSLDIEKKIPNEFDNKILTNKIDIVFNALTCVDPVIDLSEITRLKAPKTTENARCK